MNEHFLPPRPAHTSLSNLDVVVAGAPTTLCLRLRDGYVPGGSRLHTVHAHRI